MREYNDRHTHYLMGVLWEAANLGAPEEKIQELEQQLAAYRRGALAVEVLALYPERPCCYLGCAAAAVWNIWSTAEVFGCSATDACDDHLHDLLGTAENYVYRILAQESSIIA